MKGLVVDGKGGLELQTGLPMPEIDQYQCLTETVACAICNGTDTKLIRGGLQGFSTYPAVLGHESVGRVIRVGRKVRAYREGDIVLRSGLKDTPGLHSLWGGFAQYGFVDDYGARVADGVEANDGTCTQQIVPGDIDPVDGTMIITLKEITSALRRLDLKPGMDVVVVGCGPVGLSMVALARLMGAGKIIMAGHHGDRIRRAKKLGADLAFDSNQENVVDTVKRELPKGADLFIDCVGSTTIIDQGMQVVKEEGKIALYGIGIHPGDTIDWIRAPYNWNLHSVQWPIALRERETHGWIVDNVLHRRIDLRDYVSHRLPVEEFQEGMDLIRTRQGIKVALTF